MSFIYNILYIRFIYQIYKYPKSEPSELESYPVFPHSRTYCNIILNVYLCLSSFIIIYFLIFQFESRRSMGTLSARSPDLFIIQNTEASSYLHLTIILMNVQNVIILFLRRFSDIKKIILKRLQSFQGGNKYQYINVAKKITSQEQTFKSPDGPGTQLKHLEVPSQRNRNLSEGHWSILVLLEMNRCLTIFVSVG